jgi:hypothetical protein
MYVIFRLFFSKMWELRTVCRSYWVNAALVVGKVQKLTRLFFVLPVAISFFEGEPFVFKSGYRHIKVACYTLHILGSRFLPILLYRFVPLGCVAFWAGFSLCGLKNYGKSGGYV